MLLISLNALKRSLIGKMESRSFISVTFEPRVQREIYFHAINISTPPGCFYYKTSRPRWSFSLLRTSAACIQEETIIEFLFAPCSGNVQKEQPGGSKSVASYSGTTQA